ncbi:MAG: hypothetical protein K6D54_08090 [Bacteroidales bacterium]|nr:hypothetical protein [Bacteroidales bacterium]
MKFRLTLACTLAALILISCAKDSASATGGMYDQDAYMWRMQYINDRLASFPKNVLYLPPERRTHIW